MSDLPISADRRRLRSARKAETPTNAPRDSAVDGALTQPSALSEDDMNTSPGVASTDTGEKSATMRANKRARIVKADDVMTVALPQCKPAMAAVDEKRVYSADKEVTAAKKKVDTAEEEVAAAKNKVDTAEKKVHKAEKKVRKADKKVDRADKEVAAAKRKVKTAEDATAKTEAKMNLAKVERDFAKAELELAEANVKLAEVAKYSDAEITKLMGIVTRHDRILKTAQDLYDQFVNPSASSINASQLSSIINKNAAAKLLFPLTMGGPSIEDSVLSRTYTDANTGDVNIIDAAGTRGTLPTPGAQLWKKLITSDAHLLDALRQCFANVGNENVLSELDLNGVTLPFGKDVSSNLYLRKKTLDVMVRVAKVFDSNIIQFRQFLSDDNSACPDHELLKGLENAVGTAVLKKLKKLYKKLKLHKSPSSADHHIFLHGPPGQGKSFFLNWLFILAALYKTHVFCYDSTLRTLTCYAPDGSVASVKYTHDKVDVPCLISRMYDECQFKWERLPLFLYDPAQGQADIPYFKFTRASVMAVSDRTGLTASSLTKLGSEVRSYFIDMKVWSPAEIFASVKLFIATYDEPTQVKLRLMLSDARINQFIFFYGGSIRVLHEIFVYAHEALSHEEPFASFSLEFASDVASRASTVRTAYTDITIKFDSHCFYEHVRMNNDDTQTSSSLTPLSNKLFDAECSSKDVRSFKYVYIFSSPFAAVLYYSGLARHTTREFYSKFMISDAHDAVMNGLFFERIMSHIAEIAQTCHSDNIIKVVQLLRKFDTVNVENAEDMTNLTPLFLKHSNMFFSVVHDTRFASSAMRGCNYVPVATDNFMPKVAGKGDAALNAHLKKLSTYARTKGTAGVWAAREGATFIPFPKGMKNFDGCCIVPRKNAPGYFDVVMIQITTGATKTYDESYVSAISGWKAYEAQRRDRPSLLRPLGTCYVIPDNVKLSVTVPSGSSGKDKKQKEKQTKNKQNKNDDVDVFKYPVHIASVDLVRVSGVWCEALFGDMSSTALSNDNFVERVTEMLK